MSDKMSDQKYQLDQSWETAEYLRRQITVDENGNEYYKGVLLDPSWENDPNQLGMYSFYDMKSGKYDTPFWCQSNLSAKRHYTMVMEQESMIARFKEDFCLDRIGIFHLTTGDYDENYERIIAGTLTEKK